MEQGLLLCPDFVVQGTHENKLTMKISQIMVCTNSRRGSLSKIGSLEGGAMIMNHLKLSHTDSHTQHSTPNCFSEDYSKLSVPPL